MGWAWDIAGFMPLYPFVLAIAYFFGFAILAVCKARTHLWLSVLQFVSFVAIAALSITDYYKLWMLLCAINILLFLSILALSAYHRVRAAMQISDAK